MKELITLGKWTTEDLDDLLKESPPVNAGKRINFLSRQFLGAGYKESTLTGDADTQEVFVINLENVDCFTLLDYIEAMRSSGSFPEFKENLKKVRYHSGEIAYKNRNHFFTDWLASRSTLIEDVTKAVSGGKSRREKKVLNLQDDGTYFLSNVQCRDREIIYIPSGNIDDAVIERLKTGDYIGIYSDRKGLDVSHVGILIKEQKKVKFRHASSVKRKVIDEDFRKYTSDKPGIIVLRPK